MLYSKTVPPATRTPPVLYSHPGRLLRMVRCAGTVMACLATLCCLHPATGAAEENAPVQTKPPTKTLHLVAGGDVTVGYHLPEYFEELRSRGPISDDELYEYPFREVASLTRPADIFWVNLEGTFTRENTRTEKNFTFKADPSQVEILLRAGVDVVNLANNHAYDYGSAGLAETRATLAAAGIAAYGAGANLKEARAPAIIEKNGLRIGFLGYLFMGENTIEPDVLYAEEDKPGLAGTHRDLPTLLDWVREDIGNLRPQVDLVFVSFHWGREAHNLTEPYQRELARASAESGADLIVGHHPHVLQGTERIGRVPVLYSLGNFVFAGNWNPRRKDTALLDARVTVPPDGPPVIQTHFIPLSVDRQPDHPFQPYPLEGAEAERVRKLIACYGTATEEGICEKMLDAAPEPMDKEKLP